MSSLLKHVQTEKECKGPVLQYSISRKTALLFVSHSSRRSVQNSSHAECCRLAGIQTILRQGSVISSVCDTIERIEVIPEYKQLSRRTWPLLLRTDRTSFDRGIETLLLLQTDQHLHFPKNSCLPTNCSVSQMQTDSNFLAKWYFLTTERNKNFWRNLIWGNTCSVSP